MSEAIFLSAGVPDPVRGQQFAETADTVAITSAVSALLHVTLGRRPLVWGGQPAITPMIWVIAEELGVEYGRWVRLYQSRFFEDEYPQDNANFRNVTYVDAVDGDRERSLAAMRERMFTENAFGAGVFIGGMGGIIDEFEMFRKLQPDADVIPVVTSGGATLNVAERIGHVPPDLAADRDYVALFHRHLSISVKENRYSDPASQPDIVAERYWRAKPD